MDWGGGSGRGLFLPMTPIKLQYAMAKDRLMAKEIGSWKPMGASYRKEAARLRELAAEATTDLARRILEDQARAQDRLVGRAE
jgi:hypothetical protein